MKPITTADTPHTFKLPGGTKENDLPCRRANGKVTSYWHPEHDSELKVLNEDRRLVVWTHWPNVVGIKVEIGDDEFTERDAEIGCHDGVAYYYVHRLSEAAMTHLQNGGTVKFTVDMDPICPVSIGPFTTAE